MPLGPHFFIQNTLTGTVLEVKKGKNSGQTQLVSTGRLVQMLQENDHQLWLYDKATQTIRSKENGLCLDVQEFEGSQRVIISPYKLRKSSQCWVLTEDQISMNDDDDDDDFSKVISLDSAEGATANSLLRGDAQVIVSQNNNQQSQYWKIEHARTEFFYIVSQVDNKVVDVKGKNANPGAEVIMYAKSPEAMDNQLWYQDINGLIRSKMNDFALTAGPETVTLQPYTENNHHQQWTISGSCIESRAADDKVLEAKQGYFSVYLSGTTYIGTPNQHWFFEYPRDQAISINHSGTGKYAFMRCRQNEAVITVTSESLEHGTSVIVAGRRPATENFDDQLWFYEPLSGVLRSKLNGCCLCMDENHSIVIKPHEPLSKSQQWTLKAGTFYNCHSLKHVLQMADKEDGNCEMVVAEFNKGDESQLWDLDHLPANSMYIRNTETDLVLTVKECEPSSGSIIMMPKQKMVSLQQLWYEDENGLIRSKMNGYTIDTKESGIAKTKPHDPKNKKQMWMVVDDLLQNQHDQIMVLDIKAGRKEEGTAVIEYKFHGGNNQKWRFDSVDV